MLGSKRHSATSKTAMESKKAAVGLAAHYQRNQARDAFDDLILLENCTDERMTDVLKQRFSRGDIYTAIGPVLVAINPYQQLSKGGLHTTDKAVASLYHGTASVETAPHIFRTGSEAYRSLVHDHEDQCVIVTGESGAGKTETAKHLMQFITVVGDGMGGERRQSLGMLSGASHDIRNKLLETNPVLEAFGNARTKRNDNSSRFGKYMELKVDMGTGALVGGKVTNYLLERSRVPSQAPGERNFHIFHYLMAGASSEEVKRLQLLKPGEYRYMCSQAVAPEDGSGLQGVRTALTSVGINEEEQGSVMHLLSAILALGNVDFVDHGDGSAASIVSQECLERAALQLGVPATDLGLALTTSTLRVGRVGGTSQTRHLNAADSATNRDTLAKEIYKRLFDHIVARINASITHTHSCSRQGLLTLGILDIYGFEVMDTNGFEQFCINYVNEKLQQYFVAHTIKAEQDEYVEEGIPWDVIKFFDNAGVCDTIEGRGGLLPLLDEVGSHRSSTAPEFVGTLNSRLGSRPCYILGRDVSYDKAKAEGTKNTIRMEYTTLFGIEHYAGRVVYDGQGFLERNADSLWGDLVDLLGQSANTIAAAMFEDLRSAEEKAKRPVSLSLQFRRQVKELTIALAQCRPHYVRCIKPNETKSPNDFDIQRVAHQVKYLGLTQNVAVRQQGYIHRMTFADFARRYGAISKLTWRDKQADGKWSPSGLSSRDATIAILTGQQPKTWGGKTLSTVKYGIDGSDAALGKNKVFLRKPEVLFKLEDQRAVAAPWAAVLVQKTLRCWVRYRKYKASQKAAPKLHALARKFICRSKLFWLIECKRLMPPEVYALSQALSHGITVTVSQKSPLGRCKQRQAIMTSRDAGRTLSIIEAGGGQVYMKSKPIEDLDALVHVKRRSKPEEGKAVAFLSGKKLSIKSAAWQGQSSAPFADIFVSLYGYHANRGGMTPLLGSPME